MRLTGGDITVNAGTGFRGPEAIPIIEVTAVGEDGTSVRLFMPPAIARKIGLDFIGAAHHGIADTAIRVFAKQHGLDGDTMIGVLRDYTNEELPDEEPKP